MQGRFEEGCESQVFFILVLTDGDDSLELGILIRKGVERFGLGGALHGIGSRLGATSSMLESSSLRLAGKDCSTASISDGDARGEQDLSNPSKVSVSLGNASLHVRPVGESSSES